MAEITQTPREAHPEFAECHPVGDSMVREEPTQMIFIGIASLTRDCQGSR